jgi:competence protein ComEC
VIDLVVVTHPHLDHIAGILELEHRYDFKNLWLTGVSYKLNEYDQLMLQASKNSDTKIEYINQKSEYDLCGIKITVLHSGESSIGEEMENINNSSIIILLEINGKKILLTGDAEIEQEEEFLLEYRDSLESSGDVDILKAGHHGSRTSTSRELIEAVNPEYLVISSGRDNTYGHPHLETIKKADQFGIKILRTDQRGDVIFFFE